MPAKTGVVFHAAVRAILLYGSAFSIAYLSRSGHIVDYVAPRMAAAVKLAAIVLAVIGAYQLFAVYRALRQHPVPVECDCDHSPASGSYRKHTFVYALLAFPILLGAYIPGTLSDRAGLHTHNGAPHSAAFGDTAARSVERLADKLAGQSVIQVEAEHFAESLQAIDRFPDRFVGKTIVLSGSVRREFAMRSNQFVIVAQTSTGANAAAVGMRVELPQATTVKPDTKVQVIGRLVHNEIVGQQAMMVKAVEVKEMRE